MVARDDDETERWLAWETRVLPMPDGSLQPRREMRMLWAAYDYLKENFGYSDQELVAMCVEEAYLQNKPLDTIFAPAIAWLDKELRRVHGLSK